MSTTPTAPTALEKSGNVTVACKIDGSTTAEVNLTVSPEIAAATLRSLADQIAPPTPRRRRTVKDGLETKTGGNK